MSTGYGEYRTDEPGTYIVEIGQRAVLGVEHQEAQDHPKDWRAESHYRREKNALKHL